MPGESPQDSAGQLERFRDGVRFLALRSLGDPELADEVAQDTLARALAALRDGARGDPPRNLKAYVLGIARNVIASTITDRGRKLALRDAYGRLREPPDGPLKRLVDEEQAARVRAALRHLSLTDRELLRLAYYDGLKSREIAERLGEPGDRIRKRKSRAVARLRAAYLSLEPVTDDEPRPLHDDS